MTCREFTDFIGDFLSGELPVETVSQFERHLSRCQHCWAYLSNYRDAIRLGRAAFDDDDADLPSAVPEELVQAILAVRGAERR